MLRVEALVLWFRFDCVQVCRQARACCQLVLRVHMWLVFPFVLIFHVCREGHVLMMSSRCHITWSYNGLESMHGKGTSTRRLDHYPQGVRATVNETSRCRANTAHTRQSRPDSGLVFQAKVLIFSPPSLPGRMGKCKRCAWSVETDSRRTTESVKKNFKINLIFSQAPGGEGARAAGGPCDADPRKCAFCRRGCPLYGYSARIASHRMY